MNNENGDRVFSLQRVETILSKLSVDQMVELAEELLTPEIISVFKDVELKNSIDAFFRNDLNISETSRNAFMHRNTLLYRIDKIEKICGINVRNFDDASTLLLYEMIYMRTKDLLPK